MSPILLLRARNRALFVVLCFAVLVALVSVSATRQLAGPTSRDGLRRYSSVPPANPDKGGIAPEGNTITVNSTSDVNLSTDGLCVLREAIQAANTNNPSGSVPGECVAGSSIGSDVINLTGVTGTIILSGALPDITSDMTITGPGASLLTVRRGVLSFFRVFTITSGNVGISGLTVREGRTADASLFPPGLGPFPGGGILNLGTLTMTDVTVTANQSGGGKSGSGPTKGSNGGGISNQGTLTMTNCNVNSNIAGSGGTDGGVSGGGGGDGGGIHNTGTLTLNNCIVTNNTSGGGGTNSTKNASGGGIFSNGTLIVNNTSVTSNRTNYHSFDTGGDGAGIYAAGVSANITNSDISGNTSHTAPPATVGPNGVGIYSAVPLTITGSTIKDNNTGGRFGDGPGIRTTNNTTLTNSTVSGNSTLGNGGGINASATLTVVGSTISGNTGADGSGIWNEVLLHAINTTVSGNQPSAGIKNIGPTSRTFLTNCTITANGTFGLDDPGGGGLGSFLRNTIIAGNSPSSGDTVGNVGSFGHNFIGIWIGGANFVDGVNSDQVGSAAMPKDAHLGPLADNGGSTRTHALLSNSTAIDAADNCVTDVAHCGDTNIFQLISDQRGTGFSRQVDGPDVDAIATVDIGAYEVPPPLADLPDTSTNEDTQLAVPFDAGDVSTITSITATSSNAILVPNDLANLSGAVKGANGVVTINPATNLSGTTNITVTVNRTVGGPDVKTFMLTVNPVNDAPSFSKGPDQIVDEDAGLTTIPNWATGISPGPVDEFGQVLTFQITGNTNAALFSAGPAVSSTGTLTYTPAANAIGSATITINLQDNGGTTNGGVDTSSSQIFAITVNAVNDAPSFTKGADQTVNEDAGAQSVVNWATAISRGPADESAQTVTFQVTNNTNAALFSVAPAISSTGTLTYTPAANANGSATITINLKDNGGTANGGVDTSASQTFNINVTAVNDAPSFTKGANQTVNEDAGAQTVNNWATAISAGPANESGQALTFQVTGNTNASLFSAGPAISSTGVLTYTPAADANGSATLTINLKDDGGTANGGVDTSASQTFTITVNSVNDVPSFTKGADQAVNNNAGLVSVPNWATALSAGPANESGQTLTFQVTGNTNPGIFAGPVVINASGTLAFTPTSNRGGTSTITIVLRDNGGTANGGVDTSPSQSFDIAVTPVGGFINFSAATNNTTESFGVTTVTVKRTGDLSRAVQVDYASSGNNGLPCSTANGAATPKCDFTTALGTLSFAAGEDTKVVNILISQDGFVEGPETFTVSMSVPTNFAALGPTSTSTTTIADDVTEPAPPANVIDDVRNFVRQHYHDFLNREPDPSGWDFWTNQINSCGSDVGCNEVRRIDVSASFFLSIEFQQSGYLVERFYKVGYGDAVGTSTFVSNHQLNVPVVRFSEFLKDTQRIGQGVIVLAPGWEQALENNKQAYALEFVQTSRFTTALPTTLTPDQFVDRLNQNTGGVLSLSERTAVINLFGGAANSSNVTARAQAVRMVADDADLYNAEFNRAFVLAEYFGYLRRNPNDAPDSDYTGYDFWLTKLNQFNGNYINAEMVKAFLSSIEYRQRFGP